MAPSFAQFIATLKLGGIKLGPKYGSDFKDNSIINQQ
jgi:hypothetical protein